MERFNDGEMGDGWIALRWIDGFEDEAMGRWVTGWRDCWTGLWMMDGFEDGVSCGWREI